MKKLILIFMIFWTYLPPLTAAQESIYKFSSLNAEEKLAVLKKANIKNCEEFKDKYFGDNAHDPELIMQAYSYEAGLCAQQDLSKAKDLYEESFKRMPFPPNFPVRLALIYEFGPDNLRNPARADFLMKQTAIFLAVLPHKSDRMKVASVFFGDEPIPASMKKYLGWLDNVMSQPSDKKKILAAELKRQGFVETNLIFDKILDAQD